VAAALHREARIVLAGEGDSDCDMLRVWAATTHSLCLDVQAAVQPRVWIRAGLSPMKKGLEVRHAAQVSCWPGPEAARLGRLAKIRLPHEFDATRSRVTVQIRWPIVVWSLRAVV
jgi:hypothetical protein